MPSTKKNDGIVAVNLGSGAYQIAPGWRNFDNSPNLLLSRIPAARWILWKLKVLSNDHYKIKWPKEVEYRELTKRLPFEDNTVDFVYTSHFLEHVSLSNFIKIINDIYRVLKVGGTLRILVPDLHYLIKEYERNVIEKPSQAADLFMKGINVNPKARDPHLWMYDANSLTSKLSNAGFSNVTTCEYRKGDCKDVEILDGRPVDSIFVEAKKL